MNTSTTRSESSTQHLWCTSFAPFDTDLDSADRLERLRSLGAVVRLQYRSHPSLSDALTLAETGDPEWCARADDELARIPARHRRRLLASCIHHRRGAS
jgi:hypothetical protein